jgi:F-type H+-transporting ATPase subunit b
MDLVTPQLGLIFWMVVTFATALFVLGRYAWKPILKALNDREESIADALNAAKKAKEEMANMKADNERLLQQAHIERDKMLKEARELRDAIVAEAKGKAHIEANKLIVTARETINNEKLAAIAELKNQVATMSIDIAEKILRHELSKDDKQKALMESLLKDVSLN